MTLASFLETTFDSGQLVVEAPVEISDDERTAAAEVLRIHENLWRDDLPGGLPEFDAASGMWAAELLFRAAQFLAHRDINIEFVDAAFSEPAPKSRSAAVHYSVDVCFRYLFDLRRLASLASSQDPLLQRIVKVVEPWPLSSIGFDELPLVVENALLDDPALRRMYIDRLIARSQPDKIEDAQLRELVTASLGAFPQLAPKFASLVQPAETTQAEQPPQGTKS